MSYGFFRPQPQLPWALYRNRAPRPQAIIAGLNVPGTVYCVASPTDADVLAMAEDHYGVGSLDALAVKLDPDGPRTMEDFCQGWWGKPYSECRHEILLLDRFLQLIRQSSRRQKPNDGVNFQLCYFGGDMLDSWVDSNGRRRWTGSDFLVTQIGCVDLGTNIDLAASLPLRNHQTTEFKNGETDFYGKTRTADVIGAGFRSIAGDISDPTNLNNFVNPNQTTYPSTLYWPIAAIPHTGDEGFWLICWLTLAPTPGGAYLDHEPQDTHILNINIFGTVSDTGTFDIGAGGKFFVADALVDTSYRYLYGREFNPGYGDFTGGGYYANMETDHFFTYVARIPIATDPHQTAHTGTVFTNYEWWTGTGWSTDRANAARMIDNGGTPTRCLHGVSKLGANSYIGVAQDPFEDKMRVYWSDAPQGPWWNYRNVPLPCCGKDKIGVNLGRHRDFVKVYTDFPARTDYAMTTGTNLALGGGTYEKVGTHIAETDAPLPMEVPTTFGDHVAPPPSAVHRMRPLLVR